MRCVMCQKPLRGQRKVCPSICRSRYREGQKIERQIAKWYQATQRLRRAA